MKHIEEQPRGLSENAMLLKVNEIIEKMNAHHERIAALEAIAKPQSRQGSIIDRVVCVDNGEMIRNLANAAAQQHYGYAPTQNNNEDLKRDLINAQNAIEKALNHFRTTAKNHKK